VWFLLEILSLFLVLNRTWKYGFHILFAQSSQNERIGRGSVTACIFYPRNYSPEFCTEAAPIKAVKRIFVLVESLQYFT
jgi:hypothetical protein